MLIRLYFILFLFVSPIVSQASEWGVVTDEEKSYIPENEYAGQNVIVLFDNGFVTTEYHGVYLKRHIRLKVLNDAKNLPYTKHMIEHYEYDDLGDLEAEVFSSDGTVRILSDEDFTTTRKGNLKLCTIEFDNLSVGDIFEYKYSIEYYGGKEKLGPEKYFLFNLDIYNKEYDYRGVFDDEMYRNLANVPTWYFDHPVFCKSSEYVVQIGADLDYTYVTINLPQEKIEPTMERVTVLTATAYKKYTWSMKDVQPYVVESNYGENYNEINRKGAYFKLFSTSGQNRMIGGVYADKHFKYMGQNFEGYLKQYVKMNRAMRKDLFKIISKNKTLEENIASLSDYFAETFTLDSAGFVLRPVNANMKKMFKKKVATPFELNLLLIEALKLLDYETYPVLINTSNKIHFRYSGSFNHVIALVKNGDEDLFIDAAFKGCAVGKLPDLSYIPEGVLVDKSDSKPIKIRCEHCVSAELL